MSGVGEGFSTLAVSIRGRITLLWAVLCVIGGQRRPWSLPAGCQKHPHHDFDNQEYLQTLSHVSWGLKSVCPLTDTHGSHQGDHSEGENMAILLEQRDDAIVHSVGLLGVLFLHYY